MPERDAVGAPESLADSERIASEFEEFEHDVKYFAAVLHELRDEHPNEWIAIFHQRVIAISVRREEDLAALREEGIPTSRALVEQLWSADSVWVL